MNCYKCNQRIVDEAAYCSNCEEFCLPSEEYVPSKMSKRMFFKHPTGTLEKQIHICFRWYIAHLTVAVVNLMFLFTMLVISEEPVNNEGLLYKIFRFFFEDSTRTGIELAVCGTALYWMISIVVQYHAYQRHSWIISLVGAVPCCFLISYSVYNRMTVLFLICHLPLIAMNIYREYNVVSRYRRYIKVFNERFDHASALYLTPSYTTPSEYYYDPPKEVYRLIVALWCGFTIFYSVVVVASLAWALPAMFTKPQEWLSYGENLPVLIGCVLNLLGCCVLSFFCLKRLSIPLTIINLIVSIISLFLWVYGVLLCGLALLLLFFVVIVNICCHRCLKNTYKSKEEDGRAY